MRPRRKLTDTERLIRATRIVRNKTTLGKVEALQRKLKAARRRETLARATAREITDQLLELAIHLARPLFNDELTK